VTTAQKPKHIVYMSALFNTVARRPLYHFLDHFVKFHLGGLWFIHCQSFLLVAIIQMVLLTLCSGRLTHLPSPDESNNFMAASAVSCAAGQL